MLERAQLEHVVESMHVCICLHLCMHVCVYLRACVCVCVCVCVRACVRAHPWHLTRTLTHPIHNNIKIFHVDLVSIKNDGCTSSLTIDDQRLK